VAVALVEMDGTSALRDARKHRHMLLSGCRQSHVHVRNSAVYVSEAALLTPGCELVHSRAARAEDLLILPSLLAASTGAPGTYVDKAPNPLAAVARACYGWREVAYGSVTAAASIELLSTVASKLHGFGWGLHRFKLVAVAWGTEEEAQAVGQQLGNASFRRVRRVAMVNAGLWTRTGVFSSRELGHT
jgi:hypothetical protein